MKVIIVGMGDVGTQTAEDLSERKGFELVLIDSHEERCDDLAGEIDALVLNGDGTDPDILEKAGVREADALVATTDSDALNMVIAILAQRYSVSEVIVKLNKMSLRTACNEIGVDQIISPKLSAAVEITSLLHGYDVLDFSMLVRGGSRLIEINPGELAGEKIDRLDLPEGVLIVSIIRESIAKIPRGSTELQEEDILLIIAENEGKVEKVKDIFGDLSPTDRPFHFHDA